VLFGPGVNEATMANKVMAARRLVLKAPLSP